MNKLNWLHFLLFWELFKNLKILIIIKNKNDNNVFIMTPFPKKADLFESLTRCNRPLQCCKVSIQLQSPIFDSGDRLWCGARLAVPWEASTLISSFWRGILGVNTVKTLCSPHLSWRQPVPQHISQRQASLPLLPWEEILVWGCEFVIKIADDIFLIRSKNTSG